MGRETVNLDHLKQNLQRLSVGAGVIFAVSAVLLWADRGARIEAVNAGESESRLPHIAIIKHASIAPLDDAEQGVMKILKRRGFGDGEGATYSVYNAQGDFATANAIAKTVVNDNVDLIVTLSTTSLQTVAAANRLLTVPKKHLFGITTDPFSAGVGVNREEPLDHPSYLAGVGSLAPIKALFEMVQKINPQVKRIGLVWNPAEVNSEASTMLARALVKELDMELLEGNAEKASDAGEVTQSLLSRGIDVLWLSTDVTTTTAQRVMIKAAARAGVPVVSSMLSSAEHGALLSLGASYYALGLEQGEMAADVLEGRTLASIPVINWTPVSLGLNLTALEGLRDPWVIPEAIAGQAQVIFDENGRREQDVLPPPLPEQLIWNP